MPDITLKYRHDELIGFIRGMLAAKGLQPADGEIRIQEEPSDFSSRGDLLKRYMVVVDCKPGPHMEQCPVCQTALKNGVPIQRTQPAKSSFIEAAQEAEREYPVDDETQKEQDPTIIDPMLGETFDPPSPGEGASSVSISNPVSEDEADIGGSMKSLLAHNRRLTAQKEREAAERKRQGGGAGPMGAGESARPPKPGEGI